MGGQSHKQFLNLAGEFLVAGELNRRWIHASVTFGASKKADIFAYHSHSKPPARIEVKTTDKKKWPVGLKLLEETNCTDDWFWVLVHFPREFRYENQSTERARGAAAPRYFIFSSKDLGQLVRKRETRYRKRYKKKHGKKYSGPSIPNIRLVDVPSYEGAWHKIQSYFATS